MTSRALRALHLYNTVTMSRDTPKPFACATPQPEYCHSTARTTHNVHPPQPAYDTNNSPHVAPQPHTTACEIRRYSFFTYTIYYVALGKKNSRNYRLLRSKQGQMRCRERLGTVCLLFPSASVTVKNILSFSSLSGLCFLSIVLLHH